MSPHATGLEEAFLTRRDFLCRCGMGMGALGFAALLGQAGLLAPEAAAAESIHPLAPKLPQFPGQSQTCHPYLPQRRPFACGYVRSQAGAGEIRGPTVAHAQSPDRTQNRRGFPVALPVPEIRPERRRGQRIVSARGGKHRRPLRHPLHAGGPAEPRAVAHAHELRRCADDPAQRRRLGSLTAWARKTRTCPVLSPCARVAIPIKEAENWQAGFLPGVYQGTFIDPQHTAWKSSSSTSATAVSPSANNGSNSICCTA